MTREAIPQSEELAEVVSADKGSFSDAYTGSASNKLLPSFSFLFLVVGIHLEHQVSIPLMDWLLVIFLNKNLLYLVSHFSL